mmetsp:Transcript_61772/g.193606  ORF Transcript_61772/g.193606 Transcript_61772/m.193606 type:complete len:299 (-) Transcript_61772:220-1116(-)
MPVMEHGAVAFILRENRVSEVPPLAVGPRRSLGRGGAHPAAFDERRREGRMRASSRHAPAPTLEVQQPPPLTHSACWCSSVVEEGLRAIKAAGAGDAHGHGLHAHDTANIGDLGLRGGLVAPAPGPSRKRQRQPGDSSGGSHRAAVRAGGGRGRGKPRRRRTVLGDHHILRTQARLQSLLMPGWGPAGLRIDLACGAAFDAPGVDARCSPGVLRHGIPGALQQAGTYAAPLPFRVHVELHDLPEVRPCVARAVAHKAAEPRRGAVIPLFGHEKVLLPHPQELGVALRLMGKGVRTQRR